MCDSEEKIYNSTIVKVSEVLYGLGNSRLYIVEIDSEVYSFSIVIQTPHQMLKMWKISHHVGLYMGYTESATKYNLCFNFINGTFINHNYLTIRQCAICIILY